MKEHYKVGLEALRNIKKRYDISYVLSGKAKGADTFGEEWAKVNNIPTIEYPAEWDKYGNRAGILRNELMGDDADIVLAFWDGKSKGTSHMISYSKKLKKPLILKLYNQEDVDDEW